MGGHYGKFDEIYQLNWKKWLLTNYQHILIYNFSLLSFFFLAIIFCALNPHWNLLFIKVSGSQERSGDEWDDETDQNDESDKKEGEDKSNENKSNQSKSDSDSTQEWEVLSCSTEKAPLTLSDKDKTEESGHVIQHTDSVSDKSDEPSEIAIKDDLQESAHTNTTFEDQATNTENNKPVQETKSKKKKGKKRR